MSRHPLSIGSHLLQTGALLRLAVYPAVMAKLKRPAKNNNRNRKLVAGKKTTQQRRKYGMIRLGITPSMQTLQFWEYRNDLSAISSTTTLFLMDPLLSSTGLMAQYPQSAKGYYNGTNFALRTAIIVRRIEFRAYLTGAQSSTLLAGDLFNYLRYGFYKTGAQYSDSTEQYLGNGVFGGTDPDDVKRVYLDKTETLSSTAFNTTTGFNVPQTRVREWTICPNDVFKIYSTNATGSTAWNTLADNYRMDICSDSTLTPHPNFKIVIRFFFEQNNALF